MERIYNLFPQKSRRRSLRKSMTEEEIIVWSMLKKYFPNIQFRRQFGIKYYIVDFYCPRYKLAIEIDGSQHLDNRDYDTERDRYLASLGITTLRFWNADIRNNLSSVIVSINNSINDYSKL